MPYKSKTKKKSTANAHRVKDPKCLDTNSDAHGASNTTDLDSDIEVTAWKGGCVLYSPTNTDSSRLALSRRS